MDFEESILEYTSDHLVYYAMILAQQASTSSEMSDDVKSFAERILYPLCLSRLVIEDPMSVLQSKKLLTSTLDFANQSYSILDKGWDIVLKDIDSDNEDNIDEDDDDEDCGE